MKKRLFMVLAVLALTVCMLPMVVGAAEQCDDCDWEPAGPVNCLGKVTLVCDKCGSTRVGDALPVGDHSYGDYKPYSSATCTANAKEIRKCTVCPNEDIREVPNSMLEHDMETISNTATCEEAGIETKKCKNCPHEESIPSAALGHLWEFDRDSATCEDRGFEIEKCQRETCGQERNGKPTPAKGHNWTNESNTATCTSGGTWTAYCPNCKGTGVMPTPALGHNHVWVETTAPSCSDVGEESYKCTRCADIADTREIPTVPHTPVVDEAVAPTCTTTGLTEGSHCANCPAIIVAQEIVEKAPHTPVTDAAVAPTCEKTGLTEGKHCDVCDEVLVKQEVVKALGHKWNDGVETKAATYTDTGIITYTCLNDASHTYEEATPVLKVPYDPNLDSVPRTGNIFVEWLYAIFA